MTQTIVGLFHGPEAARAAVADLEALGLGHTQIGIVGSNARGQHDALLSNQTTTGQNVTTGVEAGAVVGGATGFLLGAVGLAIPIVGPVITAGVLAATLAGAGAGAVAGGLIGALVHVGVPLGDAPRYAEGVRQGGTVVTVHASEDQAATVRDVLTRRGAASDLPTAGEFHDIPDSEKIDAPVGSVRTRQTPTQLGEDPIHEVNTGEESLPR